jgi:hypothetical protein
MGQQAVERTPAMPDTIRIRFPDLSLAEANRLAESLREAIRDAAPGTKVERHRDDATTQDFGATLGVPESCMAGRRWHVGSKSAQPH